MTARQGAWRIVLVVALVAVLLAAGPVFSGDETGEQQKVEQNAEQQAEQQTEPTVKKDRQRNWRMRFMVAVVGDGGFTVSSDHDHGYGVSTRGGGGVGINFEYRYSPRMGFEMGAMALASDIGVQFGKTYDHHSGSVGLDSIVPLTFGLNFHPLKNTDVFDLSVGPLVATTFYSNIGVGSGWGGWAGVESGVNIRLGVSLAADLNLGKSRWSLNGAVKYIAYSGSSSGLDLDPL